MPDTFNPATDEIINEGTRRINGQLMSWQPSTQVQEIMDYLGLDREQAARMAGYQGDMADLDTPGIGLGGWVPSTYKKEVSPWKILGGMALAGAGGAALASALPALIGGGAAAGGAASAAPSIAASTGLTAAQAAALPGAIGAGSGLLGAGAATGLTAATAASLPGSVGGIGGGGVLAPTATTGLAASQASALPGAIGAGGIGSGTGGSMAGGGFLGTLRNIFGIGGGKGSGISDAVNLGLNVAGGIGKGRADERAQANAAAAADDAMNLRRYELERQNAGANFSAPQKRAAQVMLGDILKGYQPLTMGADGKFTGGLSAALLTDASRQAGESVQKRALDALLSGNPSGLPTDLPAKNARAQPGVTDTILGILGTGGEALDAYNTRRDQRARTSATQALADAYNSYRTPYRPRPAPSTLDDPVEVGVAPSRASSYGIPISPGRATFDTRDLSDEDPYDIVNTTANRRRISQNTRFSGGR